MSHLNTSYLRDKTCSPCLQSLVKTNLGELESRSVKIRDAVEGFHLLENSHKLSTLHYAMKTLLLTNQNARTIQIILENIITLEVQTKTCDNEKCFYTKFYQF